MYLKLHRPIAALIFGSFAGCIVLAGRFLLFGHARHLYLIWNLFLAWLPLWLALATDWHEHRQSRGWIILGFALGWLVFFPNAPYILTDVVHIGTRTAPHFWADLVLVLIFGLTGLNLGFLSLYVMQRLVARRFGWVAGWTFVSVVAVLNGFGICAGRFRRWNSWDVMLSPAGLLADGWRWIGHLWDSPHQVLLPALFATLLFIAYAMLYSLTGLSTAEPDAAVTPAFGARSQEI